MRNLIQLIYRHYVFLIFLVLLAFSIGILVNHNRHHRASFLSSSNFLVATITEKRAELSEYLKLRQTNDSLMTLITDYQMRDPGNFVQEEGKFVNIDSSLHRIRYTYQNAEVVNNATHRQRNLIAINKGSNHDVEADMGVVWNNQMVGIVKGVSPHFSVVIPIINISFKASVRLSPDREMGQLIWNGDDPLYAKLEGIPNHVNVQDGDSIVSTGFSKFFPPGMLAGKVFHHQIIEGDNFHDITVKLATNFRSLNTVQVIGDDLKEELLTLEQEQGVGNDQ